MKLQEWIKLTGIKKTELAELLDAPNQRISRILNHGAIPRSDEMVKLYWITLGAVRPDDFYDLNAVPAELQYLLEPQKRRKKYVCIDDISTASQRKRNSWKRSALDH